MKKIASLLIVLMLTVVFTPIAVYAQVDLETTDATQQDPATNQEGEADTETQTDDTSRTERLEKYKQKKQETLDKAKEARIKGRCASAQGKVTSVQARMNQVQASRENAYKQISEKLDTIIAKAEAAGVDVSALQTAQTDLQTEIDNFTATFAAFQQTLSDLAEMDCATDPAAFQAALEVSREARNDLAEQAESIKMMIKGELKQLLADLRQQLAAKQDADAGTTEAE